MVIVPVDDGDLDGGVPQRPRRIKTRKAGVYDDNFGFAGFRRRGPLCCRLFLYTHLL